MVNPLSLRVLACVAIVARTLIADVLLVLAAVSRANSRACGLAFPPFTENEIEAEALKICATFPTVNAAAVALAEQAFLTMCGVKAACGEHLSGTRLRRLHDTIQAVTAVERAARLAPHGADVDEIVRGSWTGAGYLEGRSIAETAPLIRRDIRTAADGDEGPLRGIVCWTMPCDQTSLRIEVVEVPADVIVVNTRRIEAQVSGADSDDGILSAAGVAMILAIEKIVNRYGKYEAGSYLLHHNVSIAARVLVVQRADVVTVLTGGTRVA